jgi:hypothetical protein
MVHRQTVHLIVTGGTMVVGQLQVYKVILGKPFRENTANVRLWRKAVKLGFELAQPYNSVGSSPSLLLLSLSEHCRY